MENFKEKGTSGYLFKGTPYIKSKDVNGNIIYIDPVTGKTVRTEERNGTTLQASAKIKKDQRIREDVRKKHNQRINSGQSIMVGGREVRIGSPKLYYISLSTNNRPLYMKDASKQSYEQDYKLLQLDKAEEQTLTSLGNFSSYFFPSTYLGALTDKLEGKKSFLGSLVEGNEGLGNPVANLAADIVTPYGISKGLNLLANAGKTFGKVGNKALNFLNSPYTGKWTQFGSRQYRFKPGYLGMNGTPVESRKVGDYSIGIDLNKTRSIFEDYEKSLTQYKGNKSPSSLEYNYERSKIDFDNLVKDNFVEYLSQQTGRKIKRVPIKDTKHGDIYNEGFAFVDNKGKELAYIAGSRKGGKNVYVESSYVDPEFRYKGLGKQMYFDLNDHVFSTYGTTLRSDPMQRVGSTGIGMSPSNRLWKSLRDNGMSTVEGEGFNRYDIMAEPSKITTAYRKTSTAPQITADNAANITPEQWNAAYNVNKGKWLWNNGRHVGYNLNLENNLTTHVLGNEAIKMFKEYGGEPIPEGSINGELLRKYVPEARERYGLINNENITDEEIAQALYKHSKELGGNTAAINTQGEPQLLFRGDTYPYTELKPRPLYQEGNGKDNSLGTLFLDGFDYRDDAGPFRYLYKGYLPGRRPNPYSNNIGVKAIYEGSIGPGEVKFTPGADKISNITFAHNPPKDFLSYQQPGASSYKIARKYTETGSNDLNAFIVRTPSVRDSTNEISVASKKSIILKVPKVYNEQASPMANHYKAVVEEAEKANLGLLKSNPSDLRAGEHSDYIYFALPNFNIRKGKHILPYDLRIPRNWNDPNIYKTLIPTVIGGTSAYSLYNMLQNNNNQINLKRKGGKLCKYQWGNKIIRYTNNSFNKPKELYNKLNTSPVNINTMIDYKNNYDKLFLDPKLLKGVDDYMISKNIRLPQRQAILYSIWQEGSRIGSHGNGAYGLVGWRGQRAKNLSDTVQGLSEKLYNELFGKFNADNWNDGGKGSGYKNGKIALQSFINAKTFSDALKALNYGYIRPPRQSLVKRLNSKIF